MEQEKLSQLDEYESDKTINQKEAWTRDKEEEPPSIAQTFNMDKIEIEKVKGIKTEEINIYDSPILACLSGNTTIHVVLDCGAEHNLITLKEAQSLGLNIQKTQSTIVQEDGRSSLKVVGETYTTFYREKIPLKFPALIVTGMSKDILGEQIFTEKMT